MFYAVFCIAYFVIHYFNVSFSGLFTSVGEERADFSAFDYLYRPPIFTLDLPNMHEYITRSLHSIFNHREDIVYRRSSSILISVIRISYRKMSFQYSKMPWPRGSVRDYTCEGLGFGSW